MPIISDRELARLALDGAIGEVVAESHGIEYAGGERAFSHFLVRANGRLLYREDAVRENDDLEALSQWIGLSAPPAVRAQSRTPFEFTSLDEVADVLREAGVSRFSVSTSVRWHRPGEGAGG